MATTYCAFAREVSSVEVTSGDDLTIRHNVIFWRNVDGTVTTEQAEIESTVASGALVATINDAITDSMVAKASSDFSWTLPRTRCLFPTLTRGLIV